jgi:hypothetical protein
VGPEVGPEVGPGSNFNRTGRTRNGMLQGILTFQLTQFSIFLIYNGEFSTLSNSYASGAKCCRRLL